MCPATGNSRRLLNRCAKTEGIHSVLNVKTGRGTGVYGAGAWTRHAIVYAGGGGHRTARPASCVYKIRPEAFCLQRNNINYDIRGAYDYTR